MRRLIWISNLPTRKDASKDLLVEPSFFHMPIVDDAADPHRQTFHLWLPTVRGAIVKDDRPDAVLCQDLRRPAVPLHGVQWGRSPYSTKPRSASALRLRV